MCRAREFRPGNAAAVITREWKEALQSEAQSMSALAARLSSTLIVQLPIRPKHWLRTSHPRVGCSRSRCGDASRSGPTTCILRLGGLRLSETFERTDAMYLKRA